MGQRGIGRINGIEHRDRRHNTTAQRCRWLPLGILMRHILNYKSCTVAENRESTKPVIQFDTFFTNHVSF